MLPANRQAAQSLLNHLERSFVRRNPSCVAKFGTQIEEYEQLGFSRRMRQEQLEIYHPRQCFILFHGVVNAQKLDKFRVVFNASHRFKGISLNSYLLLGPNLLKDISSHILRFRHVLSQYRQI